MYALSEKKDLCGLCKFSAFAGASAATTVRVDVLGELPTFFAGHQVPHLRDGRDPEAKLGCRHARSPTH